MFRQEVKPLTDLVKRFLRDNGLETPLRQTRVVESWDAVVGPVVARYTEEKFIRNQTLFVKIGNPALRADLGMMKTQLVNRLNQEAGAFVISDIRIY